MGKWGSGHGSIGLIVVGLHGSGGQGSGNTLVKRGVEFFVVWHLIQHGILVLVVRAAVEGLFVVVGVAVPGSHRCSCCRVVVVFEFEVVEGGKLVQVDKSMGKGEEGCFVTLFDGPVHGYQAGLRRFSLLHTGFVSFC